MGISEFLFLIVVLLSNVLQVITGFAGTLIAMPASIVLIGADEAKAILNVVSLCLCIYIMIMSYKDINIKEFIKIIAIMIVGMYVGIYLYSVLNLNSLLFWYGMMIVLIGAKKLFVKKSFALPNYVMYVLIFAAGIIHGLFVSGGALLVVYATSVFKEKKEFRATLSAVWVVLNSILVFDHISSGYFDFDTSILAVVALIPLFGSVYIGNKIYDKVDQKMFMKLTYCLLMISGLSIIF